MISLDLFDKNRAQIFDPNGSLDKMERLNLWFQRIPDPISRIPPHVGPRPSFLVLKGVPTSTADSTDSGLSKFCRVAFVLVSDVKDNFDGLWTMLLNFLISPYLKKDVLAFLSTCLRLLIYRSPNCQSYWRNNLSAFVWLKLLFFRTNGTRYLRPIAGWHK